MPKICKTEFFCKTNCSFLCVILRTFEVITTFVELELNFVFLIASAKGPSRGLKVAMKKAEKILEISCCIESSKNVNPEAVLKNIFSIDLITNPDEHFLQ